MIANKMLFLFLLISSTFAEESANRIACDGLIFTDVYYDRELLFDNRGRPYNLVIHKYSGVLFFSHTIKKGLQVDFGIAACHIEKRVCADIDGVPGGYAIAYDAGNDDIYFGGHDGIYKYNFVSKAAEFFAEGGKSIWAIFIKNQFYYIEYPSQKLYVLEGDIFVKVAEAQNIEVDQFFTTTKHHEIYFANKTALYKIERSSNNAVILNEDILVRQIVEDDYGDVFFLASDGIYIEQKPYYRVKRVAQIDNAYGMTFDTSGNVIYSDLNGIYRLLPSKHSRLCYDAITKPKEEKEEIFGRRLLPSDIW